MASSKRKKHGAGYVVLIAVLILVLLAVVAAVTGYSLVARRVKALQAGAAFTFDYEITSTADSHIFLGSDTFGNITRINNALEAIKDKIPDAKLRIEDIEKQLETAKIEVQKPFPKEEELKEKMKKLEELNILLKLDEKEKQVLDTSNDEIEDNEKDKNKDHER